ncbi:MAG: hypothetical protein DMG05_24985 [Acidobacteria bacterium]|nr:MAG: hypothetical protein DMG05_24985 [Acidobacteriota bacterium]
MPETRALNRGEKGFTTKTLRHKVKMPGKAENRGSRIEDRLLADAFNSRSSIFHRRRPPWRLDVLVSLQAGATAYKNLERSFKSHLS